MRYIDPGDYSAYAPTVPISGSPDQMAGATIQAQGSGGGGGGSGGTASGGSKASTQQPSSFAITGPRSDVPGGRGVRVRIGLLADGVTYAIEKYDLDGTHHVVTWI